MPSVLARFIYYMNFEFMRYTLIYVALCSRRLLMSKCLKLTKTIMLLGVTIKMFAAVTFILDSYHIWALIFFVMGNLSVHLSYSLRFSRGTSNVDSDLKFCLMLAEILATLWSFTYLCDSTTFPANGVFYPCIFNVKDRMWSL